MHRRHFLQGSLLAGLACALPGRSTAQDDPTSPQFPQLAETMGIVTASVHAQLTGKATGRHFTLLELPKILSGELGLSIIDLNTTSIPDFSRVESKYLDKLRKAADDANCTITNLKMNQPRLDMNSPERSVRDKALTEYKRSIDIAAHLGCRWARPLPAQTKPDMAIHVASYRELCEYAAERKVQMLVENYGWMQADPNSITSLVSVIGDNVAAGVDTGNWDSQELREQGLKNSFPIAATCDFKARNIGPRGEHPAYDLRTCFDLAWKSGFRGPWCFEHGSPDTTQLFHELGLLRGMIETWIDEAKAAS